MSDPLPEAGGRPERPRPRIVTSRCLEVEACRYNAHLVQPSTGRDVTDAMETFGRRYLESAGPVDGFLLKSRSPSCGIDGVKVHAAPEDAPPVGREPGLFAAVFRDGLSAAEKRHFLRIQQDYRERRVGRGVLLSILQSWVHRFGEEYLARQAYLYPYPRELLDLADSKGDGTP